MVGVRGFDPTDLSEPIHLHLNVDVQLHLANISWTLHQLPPTTNITYTVRVIWGNATVLQCSLIMNK